MRHHARVLQQPPETVSLFVKSLHGVCVCVCLSPTVCVGILVIKCHGWLILLCAQVCVVSISCVSVWHLAVTLEDGRLDRVCGGLSVCLPVCVTSGSWWWAGKGGRCPSESVTCWDWNIPQRWVLRGWSTQDSTSGSPGPAERWRKEKRIIDGYNKHKINHSICSLFPHISWYVAIWKGQ